MKLLFIWFVSSYKHLCARYEVIKNTSQQGKEYEFYLAAVYCSVFFQLCSCIYNKYTFLFTDCPYSIIIYKHRDAHLSKSFWSFIFFSEYWFTLKVIYMKWCVLLLRFGRGTHHLCWMWPATLAFLWLWLIKKVVHGMITHKCFNCNVPKFNVYI